MASTVKSRQDILLAIGNMVPPPTIDTGNAHWDWINDQRHQTDHRQKGHHWNSKNTVGHNRKHVTKPHTRIHKVESGSKCVSECSVASDFEEHLDEEAASTPDSPKT